MPDYGITSKGFVIRRLAEIYEESCKRFKDEIGLDPSENPQSVINTMFTIFADEPAALWEAFAAGYQNLFPNTAEGIALDNCMQIGGVSRIGQSRTKYTLSCTGREGTTIPVGALVQSNSFPQRQFQAASVSVISSSNWNVLDIAPIESVSGSFTFSFGVTRNSTSGEVGSYAESLSITKDLTVSSYDDAFDKILGVLQGFEDLKKYGISVSVQTNENNEKFIRLKSSGASDSFSATLCRYITVVSVSSNIVFESVDYGSIVFANGTITNIVTTVDGWNSCTNQIAPIKGRLVQTDAEARSSYTNRVATRGTGTVSSIASILYSDVEGVSFATGYQNDSDETDSAGRPPHCIEIVVQGGSDEDVAKTIWENKSAGIRAYGKHYAYAIDATGQKQYVEFTRVTDTYLLLSVKVTSSGGLDDDFSSRIQSLLLKEALPAGQTIRLQKFIRPIIESVSGVDYVEIKGLLSKTPDISGVSDESMLSGIVPVDISQQPIIAMNGIRAVKSS